MKLERILVIGMGCALSSAVLACGGESVGDDRRLATLSNDELGELCEELDEAWPDDEPEVQCGDGSRVSFLPPVTSCGERELPECPATAGDVRACTVAFVDDPCSASLELPAACTALQQPGCAASATPELATGCPPVAATDVAPLEGIYELVSHDISRSCEAEALSPADFEGDGFLVIVGADFFGAPIGSVESCDDLDDCRATVARIRELSGDTGFQPIDEGTPTPDVSVVIFCKADTAGELLSQEATVSSPIDGSCELSQFDTTVTRGADGALRLETRIFSWQKPAEDDSCGYRASAKPATAPCTWLEVREARFVTAL